MDLLRTGMVTDKRVATPMPVYLGTVLRCKTFERRKNKQLKGLLTLFITVYSCNYFACFRHAVLQN